MLGVPKILETDEKGRFFKTNSESPYQNVLKSFSKLTYNYERFLRFLYNQNTSLIAVILANMFVLQNTSIIIVK